MTPDPGPRGLLLCDACGRVREHTPEELLRFAREGWPRCCGRVMALFTEAPQPGPGDSSPDSPVGE